MREIRARRWVNSPQEGWQFIYFPDEAPDLFFSHVWGNEPELSPGLKDANGTEIYDGDVLEHESERPHRLRVLVEWETQEWCEDGFYTGYLFRGTTDQYTIIGNIHQNPELMEEMEK